MSERIRNVVVTVSFLLVIVGIFVANNILPDRDISVSERRKLLQKPDVNSFYELLDKRFFSDYEKYFLDQFFIRDAFRAIKAYGAYNLLGVHDNNGIYIIDGAAYKMDYPLNGKYIEHAAVWFNMIYEKYLQEMTVYYSIIPDKNYFVAAQNGFLSYDYIRLVQIMSENICNMTYIDIINELSIADYYRTDLHWKQETLLPVVEKLLVSMGRSYSGPNYEHHVWNKFYGSYYGQAAVSLFPDTITYMTNAVIDGAKAYYYAFDYNNGKAVRVKMPVYDIDALNGIDQYSLFLGGPQMIVEIENPQNHEGDELYIFRDSFGSSIAPLLLENYSKITLIDIRYINYDMYDLFIPFTSGSDVLFLFNTQILNFSVSFK